MGSAYEFLRDGRKVNDLAELQGLLIPDPDPMQGWVVFVVNVPGFPDGAYYSLSLTSGAALSPTDVRPTLLGGASRWLRLKFESTALGGTPTTIKPDDTAAEGVSTSAARSDHRHAIAADVPVPTGTTLQEGTSEAFARADHVHTTPAPLVKAWSGALTTDNVTNIQNYTFADVGIKTIPATELFPGPNPFPDYPLAQPQSVSKLAIAISADLDGVVLQGDLVLSLLRDGVLVDSITIPQGTILNQAPAITVHSIAGAPQLFTAGQRMCLLAGTAPLGEGSPIPLANEVFIAATIG